MMRASATIEILLGPTNWAQFRPFGTKSALQRAGFRPFGAKRVLVRSCGTEWRLWPGLARSRARSDVAARILLGRLLIPRVRLVDLAFGQLLRQVDLVRDAAFVVMRVLVVAAVAHRLHQARDGIAQVQRHRLVAGLGDELACGSIRRERGVRLGRE